MRAHRSPSEGRPGFFASNPVDLRGRKASQMSCSSDFPRGKLALAIMFHQLTRGWVETSKWFSVRMCVCVRARVVG